MNGINGAKINTRTIAAEAANPKSPKMNAVL
jgi:hypothetical protein